MLYSAYLISETLTMVQTSTLHTECSSFDYLLPHFPDNLSVCLVLTGAYQRFPCCSTREDLSIDVATNYKCSTDIDEARVISFFEVRTDRRTRFWNPHNYGNMSEHKIFQLKVSG